MDPNACLTEIMSAWLQGIKDQDLTELRACQESCDSLFKWLHRGGFSPGNFDRRDVAAFARIMRHFAQATIDRIESDKTD